MEQHVTLVPKVHILADGLNEHFTEGEAECPADHSTDQCQRQILGCIHATDSSVPQTDGLHDTDLMEVLHHRHADGKLQNHKGYDDQCQRKDEYNKCNDQ